MHSALQSVLCTYMAKERNKVLRQEFGAQETNKKLLAKEYSRLKIWVDEVKVTMKETLEFMDKLQAELNEANASNLILENWAKTN